MASKPMTKMSRILKDPTLNLSEEERADLARIGIEDAVRQNLHQEKGSEPSPEEVDQATSHTLLLLFKLIKEMHRMGEISGPIM
ncbi:MAG: hypothetical protein ABIB97_00475 [Patescibacteria group bacterium]